MIDSYKSLIHTNIASSAVLGDIKLLEYNHKGEEAKAIAWQYNCTNRTIALDVDGRFTQSELDTAMEMSRAKYAEVWQSSESKHFHVLLSEACLPTAELFSFLCKFGDHKYAKVVCYGEVPEFALRVSPIRSYSKKFIKAFGHEQHQSNVTKMHKWACH